MVVRKPYYHAEQVSSRCRLPQHVAYRVFPFRFGPEDQGTAEARLFDLLGPDTMGGNVLDPVLGPDQLTDSHTTIMLQSDPIDNNRTAMPSRN